MKGDKRREKQMEKMKAKASAERTPEQLNEDRIKTVEWIEKVIPTHEKEIAFREEQISTGNILEKSDKYVDGKKRDFEIEFEIKNQKDILAGLLDQLKFVKKDIEEYDRTKEPDKTST